MILLAEVVSDFRGFAQLERLMKLANQALHPDGLMVFNVFLAHDGFEPDELTRQMAEVAWACLYTRQELQSAMEGTALSIVANDSVVQFEKANLPPNCWPPTPWFESWASGRSIFPDCTENPPLEMRWIVLQKLKRNNQ